MSTTRNIPREIIISAIEYEPYVDHGEPPAAEHYADVILADLTRNGFTITEAPEDT